MSITNFIFPIYDAIFTVVNEDQKRRTIKTEAEMKILIKTEIKRKHSEIEEKEKQAQHERNIDTLLKTEEAKDLLNQREHDRQIAFENHRVQLFERIKKTEIEIHQQIMAFDIDKQKELREWQRDFIKKLEDESEQVITDRVPRMLLAAEPFREHEDIYQKYVPRIFQVADKITESIAFDQEHFRDALKDLAKRPEKLTDILIEINEKLRLSSETKKMIENQNMS